MNQQLSSVKWSVSCIVTIAAAASASASTSFGQLSHNGTAIPLSVGSGIGNDGFTMNQSDTSFGSLLIGIKAHEYYSNNNPAGASTQSAFAGGGSWLDLDPSGAYTAYPGIAANHPSWNPNAPRWAFTWSVTDDGARAALGVGMMTMVITRPDSVAVTLGTWDIGGANPNNNEPWYQNSWNLGYLGVFGNGVDATTTGIWKVRIDVTSGGAMVGSQEISINVVPAPGAIALAGIAGLLKGRRRR